jgi:hypothetical protein
MFGNGTRIYTFQRHARMTSIVLFPNIVYMKRIVRHETLTKLGLYGPFALFLGVSDV